jgi:hypothetical protein
MADPQEFVDVLEKIRFTCHAYNMALEKGNHPELDTSELLDQTGVQQHQSLYNGLFCLVALT